MRMDQRSPTTAMARAIEHSLFARRPCFAPDIAFSRLFEFTPLPYIERDSRLSSATFLRFAFARDLLRFEFQRANDGADLLLLAPEEGGRLRHAHRLQPPRAILRNALEVFRTRQPCVHGFVEPHDDRLRRV